LLPIDFTANWTDAELRAAEIQAVSAIAPVGGADTEHLLAVCGFHLAHRAVAALARFQAGKIVAAPVCLLDYFRRNREHLLSSPSHVVLQSNPGLADRVLTNIMIEELRGLPGTIAPEAASIRASSQLSKLSGANQFCA
jgi:hypothetical protein